MKATIRIIIPFILFSISCNNGQNGDLNMLKIDKRIFKDLSTKKIYFGHQSVGYNIIDGMRIFSDVNLENKVNIKETDKDSDFTNGVFGHSQIGINTVPESKINDFVKKIEGGLGDVVNIAFFKLCYVDINEKTDIDDLFSYYKKQMSILERTYPHVKFLHVTVPLKTNDRIPLGIKQKIKHFIKSIFGIDTGKNENMKDNVMRNKFNELMKKNYSNIIDLASFQSQNIHGENCTFIYEGKQYQQLCNEYTIDSGHLNTEAKRIISIKFIIALMNIQ